MCTGGWLEGKKSVYGWLVRGEEERLASSRR